MNAGRLSKRMFPLIVLATGVVAAAVCTALFPAVEGLGNKVRLPVFHGAMTWVNLTAFSVLALLAVAYLVTTRERLYSIQEGVRWIAIPMWLTGSGLGLLAALNTWDFTSSKSSPITVALEDPRLMAQLWVLIAALAVAVLPLLVDEKKLLAGADIGLVALMWTVILRAVLGPGRALHPDSPVMNSDEIFIKLMFFGIVAGLAVATVGAVWLIAQVREAARVRALDDTLS